MNSRQWKLYLDRARAHYQPTTEAESDLVIQIAATSFAGDEPLAKTFRDELAKLRETTPKVPVRAEWIKEEPSPGSHREAERLTAKPEAVAAPSGFKSKAKRAIYVLTHGPSFLLPPSKGRK